MAIGSPLYRTSRSWRSERTRPAGGETPLRIAGAPRFGGDAAKRDPRISYCSVTQIEGHGGGGQRKRIRGTIPHFYVRRSPPEGKRWHVNGRDQLAGLEHGLAL